MGIKMKLPKLKLGNPYKKFFITPKIENTVLSQAKKEKNIVYGGRSIKKQIGLFGRYTEDWDLFATKPKSSALKTEKKLDSHWGSDHYYTKPATHPGTWKVMSKGKDGRKKTKDDYGVADYSRMPRPKPKFVMINGVRYRKLSQEKKAKYKSLKDKEMKFRHQKDRGDVERIKVATGKTK